MFKTINALSIAISLSLVVVMQPQALSGTVGAITSWGLDMQDQVTNTPSGTDFAAIAGGDYHSLALKSDGSIVGWGRDGHNQVTNTPTETGFTAIAGGYYHSLALNSDGSVISWGRDNFDQVSNTPAGTGFTHIAGGGYHSLAFTIPEPHTLLLASLASLGLTLRRRRSAR